MFPHLPARATFVADTKFVSGTQNIFLILFRNILCAQQMFPSLRSPRNIMGNNVSSFTRAFRYGRERPGTGKNLCETRKWNSQFHRKISNGKTGLPFQRFHFFPWNFPVERAEKSCSIFIPTGIFGIFCGKGKLSRTRRDFPKCFKCYFYNLKTGFRLFTWMGHWAATKISIALKNCFFKAFSTSKS